MAHPQTPEFMREIGKLGGRPKGAKSQATIDKEKAREIYLQRLADDLHELTDIQLEQAKKPENAQERMYALNQVVGKAIEKVEVEQTTTLKVDV